MFWVDPDTGCRCSGQADYWLPEDRILVDYKTHGRAIRPGKQAQRWLMDASYHVALAHYCAGIKAALGYMPDEVYVIAQESVEPHAVAVYRLTTTMLALGQWQRQRALQVYMQASASNIWEGYPAKVVDLDPPAWAKPDGFIDWHIEQLSAAMQQQLAEADVEAEIATINARIKTITVEAVRAANALEFQQAVDIWAEAKALKVTLAGLQA